MKKQTAMNSGFTLLEVLLVLAIIATLSAFAFPIAQSIQVSRDLDTAQSMTAYAYRRAQVLSRAVSHDSAWGVRVATGTVTLFRGMNFAARNQNFDEVSSMSESISATGVTEVVFTKLYGLPTVVGTTTLTALNGEVLFVAVNVQGLISL